MYDLEKLTKLAQKNMGERRYNHVLAVSRLAGELALAYDEDENRAQAAGLLHDITKELDKDVQLQIMKSSGIIMDNSLWNSPSVYHSVTGSLYAENELQITDQDILNAIRYHTTGREGMSILEKIIYIADAVGYDRTYKEVTRLRKLAFKNLDACMFEILAATIKKLVKAHAVIAADTFYCYNALAGKLEE